jgi:hypothetical protein
LRPSDPSGCPGAKKPIYFLQLLDYHISKPQGLRGAVWDARLRWGPAIPRPQLLTGLAALPHNLRVVFLLKPGPGKKLSTWFFCTAPVKFTDHLAGVSA